MSDHYEILGVPRDADTKTIKAAYKKLAKIHHPDTHPDDPYAATRMAMINDAYAVLSDPEKRRHYDATGENAQPDLYIQAHGRFLQGVTDVLQQRGDDCDLIGHVKRGIEHDIALAQQNIEKGADAIEMLKRSIKRIKYRGNRQDFMSKMLGDKLVELNSQMRLAKRQREILQKALLVAEEYEYEHTPQHTHTATWGQAIYFGN